MSFLDQLQQSTGLLTEQVKNTQPFGSYTPTASDYVTGVPQNRFVGNQFQMPTLGLQPGQNIPVFGGTYSSSPYTPAPFGGAFGSSEMTQPTINPLVAADPVAALRGGEGGERTPGSANYKPGVSTEVIGGRVFRFNADGTVTQIDPNSLDAKLATTVNSLLGYTPMNMAKGLLGLKDNPNDIYKRIENIYGTQTALDFSKLNAEAINKALTSNAEERRAAVEKGFLSTATQEQKDRLSMTDEQRGIFTARTDPSKVNGRGSKSNADRQQDRADRGQRGEKAGSRGRGQYGGR